MFSRRSQVKPSFMPLLLEGCFVSKGTVWLLVAFIGNHTGAGRHLVSPVAFVFVLVSFELGICEIQLVG